APHHIVSDSKYAIEGLTIHLSYWEDKGWINIANARLFWATAAHLHAQVVPTMFQWVKGHEVTQGNLEADRLAGLGARKTCPDQLDLSIPDEFNLMGAHFMSLTQHLAYAGVRAYTPHLSWPTTVSLLDLAHTAVQDICGWSSTDATLWLSVRSHDISCNLQDFLWKGLHRAFRCGHFWSHLPGYEEQVTCEACSVEESLSHILTECTAPGQLQIWDL
ncbi:hypothetical protein BKA93DRAFT_700196, partial [Sparassis latifolia]